MVLLLLILSLPPAGAVEKPSPVPIAKNIPVEAKEEVEKIDDSDDENDNPLFEGTKELDKAISERNDNSSPPPVANKPEPILPEAKEPVVVEPTKPVMPPQATVPNTVPAQNTVPAETETEESQAKNVRAREAKEKEKVNLNELQANHKVGKYPLFFSNVEVAPRSCTAKVYLAGHLIGGDLSNYVSLCEVSTIKSWAAKAYGIKQDDVVVDELKKSADPAPNGKQAVMVNQTTAACVLGQTKELIAFTESSKFEDTKAKFADLVGAEKVEDLKFSVELYDVSKNKLNHVPWPGTSYDTKSNTIRLRVPYTGGSKGCNYLSQAGIAVGLKQSLNSKYGSKQIMGSLQELLNITGARSPMAAPPETPNCPAAGGAMCAGSPATVTFKMEDKAKPKTPAPEVKAKPEATKDAPPSVVVEPSTETDENHSPGTTKTGILDTNN